MLLQSRLTSGTLRGLADRAESRRIAALLNIPQDQQANLGQFFTPRLAAQLIASFPRLPETGPLRILDPGAGSGMLVAALAARVLEERPGLPLHIVAIEIDPDVMPFLKETLEDVVAAGREIGADISYTAINGDYIDNHTGTLGALDSDEPFDIVIMNPPYRKLGATSAHRKSLSRLGVDCPNIYAGFLALGAMGLRDGGQMVAITPRSFANGPYFDSFRNFLLDRVTLDRIHVFDSRSTVFSDTGVLQENVIFSATRNGDASAVVLSVSRGHEDEVLERSVSYVDVIKPGDTHKFIRLLVNDDDTATAEVMAAMPATLASLGTKVSTGRVVDFRSRECLLALPQDGSFPLIYPGNVRDGQIEWPRAIRKDQAFAVREAKDEKFLLPEGYYVVVKRFSAKEERRRVVAAVWDPSVTRGQVAFENHLNVFHIGGAGLSRGLAVGLSYWLNSSIVDRFFRTFSGHTQVNATDLRSLRYPSQSILTGWGKTLDLKLPTQEEVDAKVAAMLGLLRSAGHG